MSDQTSASNPQGGMGVAFLEVLLAVVIAAWGMVIMFDSRRMGAGWETDGPQSGFFSFNIGLVLFSASAILVLRTVSRRPWVARTSSNEPAITMAQAGGVCAVMIPTIMLVAAMPYVGTYIGAAIYLAWFVKSGAGMSWIKSVIFGIVFGIFLFLIFQIGFGVQLPISAFERYFGY